MGRGKRALAAAAILAVLAAASIAAAPRAAAEGGELRGDLPVAGGFALVSWSGGPADALAEAARSRGCNVDAVYANAGGLGIVGYFPAARVAAANREFLAAYPDGLPASPVYVACGEPALPRIVFLDDVTEERRAAIREVVASVVRFYAERFGVVVPESTLYVAPEGAYDTAAALFRDLTGREYPLFAWQEGGVATDTPEAGILAFVSGRFVNESRSTLDRVLAHEYYHMIQRNILRAGGSSYLSPEWLTEGTARYAGVLYDTTHCGCQYSADFQTTWAIATLHWEASFKDIAATFGIQHYDIAASAVHWLVEKTGNPHSHIEYWRALANESDWRSAFAFTFGIQVGEFFDTFDLYRADLHRKFPYVRGKVFDLERTPLSGVRVVIEGGHANIFTTTDESGRFEAAFPEGRYHVSLIGSYNNYLVVDANSGYANACPATMITVEGTGANVEIKVAPELLTFTMEPICNEGRPGFRMISGTVFAADGTKLAPILRGHGYQYNASDVLSVCLQRSVGLRWEHVSCVFDDDIRDQSFIFYVGEGSYRLKLEHLRDYGVLGEGWYADGGITTEPDRATLFEIEDVDITGIEVRLPANFPRFPFH